MTVYRPVTIQVQELDGNGEPKEKQSVFEIHLGRPGKPLVYRRRHGSLTKVTDEKTLKMVAHAFRRAVDASKATDEMMERRRKTWWYRLLRWLYELPGRMMAWLRIATGPSWRSWFS